MSILNFDFFKKNIAPLLSGYELVYSCHPEGDFGSIERVDLSGKGKIATIDFWSKGWVSIDSFDFNLDKPFMTVLLDPNDDKEKIFEEFIEVLIDGK